ncbi:MAG: DUF2064 domain-containing protein [Mycobacteriales bacterium]
MLDVQLVVMAKAPVPGRVKTRLCPPLTLQQAADVATAALTDTLLAVTQAGFRRRVLALEGPADRLVPAGFDLLAQRGAGLDERLAAACDDAFATCALPLLLVGMDTPQLTAGELAAAANTLLAGCSALGVAEDGGWWAIGLQRPDAAAFLGVPMSTAWTGRAQQLRMCERGLRPSPLPVLRDIDTIEDLMAVEASMPRSSRLSAVVSQLTLTAAPVCGA